MWMGQEKLERMDKKVLHANAKLKQHAIANALPTIRCINLIKLTSVHPLELLLNRTLNFSHFRRFFSLSLLHSHIRFVHASRIVFGFSSDTRFLALGLIVDFHRSGQQFSDSFHAIRE